MRIARAGGTREHPARVLLVAAMNPCPCGEGGSVNCRCQPGARTRYGARVSGPLLDRIDVMVHVDRPAPEALLDPQRGESSADVAARVEFVRNLAHGRDAGCNADLDQAALDRFAMPDEGGTALLHGAIKTGVLSARGVMRARAVARTVRDLDDAGDGVRASDVAQAIAMRARPPMGGDRADAA